MIILIGLIAIVTAMKLGRPVLSPIALGFVVAIVVSPLADRLEGVGVPRVLTSSVLLILALSGLALLLLSLGPIIANLVEQLPIIEREIQGWLDMASGVLRGIEQLNSELSDHMDDGGASSGESEMPTVVDAIWMAPNLGAQVLIFAGTLFFLVLTRPDLYAQAGHYAGRMKKADRAVARYFATVSLINAGLGVAVTLVMMLIGLPGAIMWGAAAMILNFVLYLGPMVMIAGLLIAGLTQLGGAYALVPPLAFLCLNLLEAQFVTPAFVGQRLEINPLGVFLAIVFGLWIWGPVGAIVALPLVVWAGTIMTTRSVERLAMEKVAAKVA
jgi:predicted PurR-regulated permease PerM